MINHLANRESVRAVLADVAEGRRRCVDVVESRLSRIDEREGELKAWVLVDRAGALARARELDAERASGGLRPLHGVPVAIKDIVDVRGLPTLCGAPVRERSPHEYIAINDAPVVRALRDAGAIILGKTVTTTYAWIDPPATKNPWNLERTPGGSSSGSAVAVAAGMCSAAIGTQTGGSITRPAAFCGIVGVKPTKDLLSTDGIEPFSASLDTPGPMAGDVYDAALVLAVLQGVRPEPLKIAEAPPRILRLRGAFDDLAEPAMTRALDRFLEAARSSGAIVRNDGAFPDFDRARRAHRVVMAAEAARHHARRFEKVPEDFPPRLTDLLREGAAVSAVEYLESREIQRFTRESLVSLLDSGFDLLAVPSARGGAPDPSTTGDPVFNSVWTFSGLPTVSIPVGLDPDGLPLSVQLVGRPWTEPALLRAAAWCEATLSLDERYR